MVHLSCNNCIFLFQSFLVISCEKKKNMKLVIILSLNTNHQSGWTLILILTIAKFFDSQIYFFISQGRYHYFVKATHAKFSPFPPAIFPLNNLCKILLPIRSQANTTKILERGYREFRISIPINDWSNRLRYNRPEQKLLDLNPLRFLFKISNK